MKIHIIATWLNKDFQYIMNMHTGDSYAAQYISDVYVIYCSSSICVKLPIFTLRPMYGIIKSTFGERCDGILLFFYMKMPQTMKATVTDYIYI